jgi:hypothetical protein
MTTTMQAGPRNPVLQNGTWARYLNILIGIWLFISAFAWQHSVAARTNSWICGVLAVLFAAMALAYPAVRWLNTILGIWLIVAGGALHHVASGTQWNNIIIGAVILLVSLVPSKASRPPTMAGTLPPV